MAYYGEVPPPTRGWPRHVCRRHRKRSGSPAHAGMAPPAAATKRGPRWFPRPRGDGPRSYPFTFTIPVVPPPTRGWPLSHLSSVSVWPGSPAHAGMAPVYNPVDLAAYGFPRPRGDGPMTGRDGNGASRVPPPTRGWPLSRAARRPKILGSPAHAGMAPRWWLTRLACSGFPRPRGDGPSINMALLPTTLVPPPTRGWPLACWRSNRAALGSPAHAGMAP